LQIAARRTYGYFAGFSRGGRLDLESLAMSEKRSRSRRVLVVDDDDLPKQTLCRGLETEVVETAQPPRTPSTRSLSAAAIRVPSV